MKPINQKSRRHYFNAITNHLLESCTVQHTEMLSRLHRFFRSSIFVRDVRWRLVRGIICPCHIVLCLCSCCRPEHKVDDELLWPFNSLHHQSQIVTSTGIWSIRDLFFSDFFGFILTFDSAD